MHTNNPNRRLTRAERWAEEGRNVAERRKLLFAISLAAGVFVGNDIENRFWRYGSINSRWSEADQTLMYLKWGVGAIWALLAFSLAYSESPNMFGYLCRMAAHIMDAINPEENHPRQEMRRSR